MSRRIHAREGEEIRDQLALWAENAPGNSHRHVAGDARRGDGSQTRMCGRPCSLLPTWLVATGPSVLALLL